MHSLICPQKSSSLSQKRKRESGLSAIEYIAALVIIMIAFTGWLRLTSTAVKQGNFVKKIVDVEKFANEKSAEVLKNIDNEIANMPPNATTVGSVAPDLPASKYFLPFDENGDPAAITTNLNGIPNRIAVGFNLQWKIVKDDPSPGDISIYTSVSYNGFAGKLTRFAKEIKSDPTAVYNSGGLGGIKNP